MSTVTPNPKTAQRNPVSLGQSQARRDQLVCIATVVALMAAIFALQPFLTEKRAELVREPPNSVRSLAIAFPRLTLGGFRGLLATMLWINAENDKNDHKWVQLETNYSYIATLEPYFATVYTYNAWNQAYNLSAQWHTDDTKYTWVLDGLMYLYEGEIYNPNHPDLVDEEGNMYLLKLGGAYERTFYRSHWRYDIAHLYEINDSSNNKDKIVAEVNKILQIVQRPYFHIELMKDNKGDPGHGIEISDLLPGQKEPIKFPYGVSPFYFAYREYQRCLDQPTPPSNVGIQVIQSYPAMSERLWCRDDVYFSADTMRHMFLNQDPQTDQFSPKGKPPAREEFDDRVLELRDCYRNVAMIAPKAINDFEVFINMRSRLDVYSARDAEGTHRKHIMETQFLEQLSKAESEMFEGLVQYTLDNRNDKGDDWTDKPQVSPTAAAHFRACIAQYATAIISMNEYANRTYPPLSNGMPNPDMADFQQRYVSAVNSRIEGARSMLALQPGKLADFMFLQGQIVEK